MVTMARVDLVDFMVTGRGDFPFDMLRHDECWPTSADNTRQIMGDGRRTVELRTWRESNIHPGRWDSSNWVVTRNPEGR